MVTLDTTNLLLAILTVLSLLEVLAFLAIGTAGVLLIRRVLRVLEAIDTRHVAPAAARVNAILDDVESVTSAVKEETLRVQRIVRWGTDWIRRFSGAAHRRP